MASRIAFTLPISCQICLGKVKEPVVCSNQHVFCKDCIDLWLERNNQCPTCRVAISADNPYRPVLGGLNPQTGIDNEHFSSRELRRSRMELLYKDYENEIEHLQVEIDLQKQQIAELRNQNLAAISHHQNRGAFDQPGSIVPANQNTAFVESLQHELKETLDLYRGAKTDLDRQKKEFVKLTDGRVELERENQRLKLDLVSRSPRRYGRYTVVTMENKIQSLEREVQQLNRALEKSDSYIAELEAKLCATDQSGGPSSRADSHGPVICLKCGTDTTHSNPNTLLLRGDFKLPANVAVLVEAKEKVSSYEHNLYTQDQRDSSRTYLFDSPSVDGDHSDLSVAHRGINSETSNASSGSKPTNGYMAQLDEIFTKRVTRPESSFGLERPSQSLSETVESGMTFDGVNESNTDVANELSLDTSACTFSLPSPDVASSSCSNSCKKKLRFMLPEEEGNKFGVGSLVNSGAAVSSGYSNPCSSLSNANLKLADYSFAVTASESIHRPPRRDAAAATGSSSSLSQSAKQPQDQRHCSSISNPYNLVSRDNGIGSSFVKAKDPAVRSNRHAGNSNRASHALDFHQGTFEPRMAALDTPHHFADSTRDTHSIQDTYHRSHGEPILFERPPPSSETTRTSDDLDSPHDNGADMNLSLTPEIKDCLRLMDEAEEKVRRRGHVNGTCGSSTASSSSLS